MPSVFSIGICANKKNLEGRSGLRGFQSTSKEKDLGLQAALDLLQAHMAR